MKLNGLLDLGQGLPAIDEMAAALAAGQIPAGPLDIYHAARPYVVAALARALNRPLVVITARSVRARQWVDELRVWLPDEVPVHNFADPDALPYERIPWAPETRQRRLEALMGLLSWSSPTPATPYAPVAVASARGLMQMTLAGARDATRHAADPAGPGVRSGPRPVELGGPGLREHDRGGGAGPVQPAGRHH